MDEKVLVLDIDGTLTNSRKEISPNTKRAIQETLKRGHKVILASGRPTPGMRRYATRLISCFCASFTCSLSTLFTLSISATTDSWSGGASAGS